MSRSLLYFLLCFLVSVNSQRVNYLSGLNEFDRCPYKDDPLEIGVCRKISDCRHEFERFKATKGELRVCSYHVNNENSSICCPNDTVNDTISVNNDNDNIQTEQRDSTYSLNYTVCRDQYLDHRQNTKTVEDLLQAIEDDKRPISDEDCANIDMYGRPSTRCSNKEIQKFYFIAFGTVAKEGDWQNMAAIGWTQPSFAMTQDNREIVYNCGGIIVNDRYVVTAAHCERYKGNTPDTLRVGDRYLKTNQDDEHAQQLKIEKFISHPQYKSSENYNDIAVIKTRERIQFSKFVAPACILVDDDLAIFYPSIAGYGQSDIASNVSNVLQEIVVQPVDNAECNEIYSDQPKIPNGIIDSQLCVQGIKTPFGDTPDSCLGDSGGPVQYRLKHTVRDIDYDKTLLKTVFDIPSAVGIVSFGIGCSLEIPSVNTRISHYVEWIETVMNEN